MTVNQSLIGRRTMMLSETSISILKGLAPILIQVALFVFIFSIGLIRLVLSGSFDDILKKLGTAVITVFIALIGFSYKMTINEPIQIDNKAGEYLQESYKVNPEFERMAEFQLFYYGDWYPSIAELSNFLQKGTESFSKNLSTEGFVQAFDKGKIDTQLNRLDILEIKGSTFIFDDKTHAELVKAASAVNKQFVSILTEIKGVQSQSPQLTNAQVADKALLCSKYAVDAAHKMIYVEELEKRVETTYNHNKFIKEYNLEKNHRLQVSTWVCNFT